MPSGSDPVGRFIASVIAHAREADDPQWYRVALIAESLHARRREINDGGLASAMGYAGSADSGARGGIAIDALQQAQASLDTSDPDLAAVKTGIVAARALIGTKATRRGTGGRYLFALMLGKTGGLAPKHLTGNATGRLPSGEDDL